MATVTGLTAERMLAIEAASVVDGDVVGDDLILTKHNGSTINAGNVRGATGATGPMPSLPDASETVKGVAEVANSAEILAGTDNTRMVSPAGLQLLTATDLRKGIVELATAAEVITGTDTTRAVTAAGLAGLTATDTRRGLVELATNAEVIAGTDTARAITAAGLLASQRAVAVQGMIPSSVVIAGAGSSSSVAADGTVTLTACTSFSLNSVFDGVGGDGYLVFGVLLNPGNTISSSVTMKYRKSGADLSTGYYHHIFYMVSTGWGAASTSPPVQANGASHSIGFRSWTHFDIKVKNPFSAAIETEMIGLIASDGTANVSGFTWGRHTPLSADGLSVFNNVGAAMTGWIKVVKVA